jgi:hypothetical protein
MHFKLFRKKIIDKDYLLGSKPFVHPYKDWIPIQLNIFTNILKIYNIIIVILRNTKNYFIIISLLIFLLYMIYNYLLKYKFI